MRLNKNVLLIFHAYFARRHLTKRLLHIRNPTLNSSVRYCYVNERVLQTTLQDPWPTKSSFSWVFMKQVFVTDEWSQTAIGKSFSLRWKYRYLRKIFDDDFFIILPINQSCWTFFIFWSSFDTEKFGLLVPFSSLRDLVSYVYIENNNFKKSLRAMTTSHRKTKAEQTIWNIFQTT
jgi:hypothetical protein